MRQKLVRNKLWEEADGRNPAEDMVCAWSVLARLGAPYRYAGMAPDGRMEYLVLNAGDGSVLASGKGHTSAEAMCQAALAASCLRTGDEVSSSHH
jgi:hypothetical protein